MKITFLQIKIILEPKCLFCSNYENTSDGSIQKLRSPEAEDMKITFLQIKIILVPKCSYCSNYENTSDGSIQKQRS